MDTQTQERRHNGFAIGLLTGAFVGAGLALWLAPAPPRSLVSASLIRPRASVSELPNDFARSTPAWARKSTSSPARASKFGDEVAGVVARSAREVERFATASSTQSR